MRRRSIATPIGTCNLSTSQTLQHHHHRCANTPTRPAPRAAAGYTCILNRARKTSLGARFILRINDGWGEGMFVMVQAYYSQIRTVAMTTHLEDDVRYATVKFPLDVRLLLGRCRPRVHNHENMTGDLPPAISTARWRLKWLSRSTAIVFSDEQFPVLTSTINYASPGSCRSTSGSET